MGATCGDHACSVLKNDGTAEVWGDAGRGGDASGVTLTNVASIMCGGSACAVLRNDGTGETWGASAWGAGVQLTNIKMCQPVPCCPITTTLAPTTSTPTKSPTTSPTSTPTNSPTTAPSKNPSKSPTKSPSKSPSRSPSSAPTAESFLLKIDGFHGSPIDALSDVAKAQKR